ncbi:MAG: hypothetical protein HQK83_03475 [Fibrobacteria bacterium]|nr:hypothetical protein [Fibrobacteria bacterium]
MTTITQSTSIECTPRELFQFLTKPANIVSVSPHLPSLSFYSPSLMLGKGQIVHSALNYGLFQLTWNTKITKFEPYTFFEGTLVEGPFKKWVHRHHFEYQGKKTIIHDEIEYEVGLGLLGKLIERLIINYQIENFLKERMKNTTAKIKQVRKNIA